MTKRSKLPNYYTEVKMGKLERKYVFGIDMKYLRKQYARAVRRDEPVVIKDQLGDLDEETET